MKIAALLMALAALFFLWIAFRTYFLKRTPHLIKMPISADMHGTRYGSFAAYYGACTVAALYISALFYSEIVSSYITIPAICVPLIFWQRILFRRV